MTIKSLDQLSRHVCNRVSELITENRQVGHDDTSMLVGVSAGLDSTVLLHLLVTLCERFDKTSITAIHINHGVHEHSEQWARFCQRFCDMMGTPLVISRHELGSITANREAQYRRLRYQTFREHLARNGLLFTAHHQNDQAETVLYNLFRGAGLRGLSAMKEQVPFGAGRHVRPLLPVPQQVLRDYAQHHQLEWMDDPSNEDTVLDRNYIRQRIIPLIEGRWPAAVSSIFRGADNLAQAERIVDEIGLQDMSECTASEYHGVIDNAYLGVLDLNRVDRLTQARRMNTLRYWTRVHSELNLSNKQLIQVSHDLCHGSDSGLFELDGYQFRVYKRCLYLMHCLPQVGGRIEKPLIQNDVHIFKSLAMSITLTPGNHASGIGISQGSLIFARRSGGETIRCNGMTRDLKSLYQEHSIPPWEREIIPLVLQGKRVVAVPGIVLADDSPFISSSVSKLAG